MQRILVTGGAGFIGSNLCRLLAGQENEIICMDDLYTGSRTNVSGLLKDPKFRFVKHNIIEPFDQAADQIYNLACPASPIHYQRDPVRTLKTSTVGLMNVLDNAEKYGSRVLQASTSEVYGDPLEHPQREEQWGHVNPNGIRSCYDEGKRAAESIMFAYNQTREVDIRIARIFNTYGPNMQADDGRVVSNFIVQALHGSDLTIYGKGEQTRSFCYVTDMIDGLYRLMNTSNVIGPINLGNPRENTVLELAEIVKKMIPGNYNIVFRPLPKDDPCRRNPDITLAREQLGWEPKVPLEKGLALTIDYFKSSISRNEVS